MTHEGSYREPDIDPTEPADLTRSKWLNYILFEMSARLGLVERTGKSVPMRDADEDEQGYRRGVPADGIKQDSDDGSNRTLLPTSEVVDRFFTEHDEMKYRMDRLDK